MDTTAPYVGDQSPVIYLAGAQDRQTVDIPASPEWKTVPFEFVCKSDTKNGRIEIVGKGRGTFRIGAILR